MLKIIIGGDILFFGNVFIGIFFMYYLLVDILYLNVYS